MRVLVVGGGGREHAIAWKLRQSPKVKELFVALGNAGTAQIARNLPIRPSDIEALAQAAQEHQIDLAVIGPEAPLAAGIVDLFNLLRIPVFGPTQGAAAIESSKVFAKRLMEEHRIPCAKSSVFSSLPEARNYVKRQQTPIVIKADGLAAGKGVTVAQTQEEALKALDDCMKAKVFGDAGKQVLVEEYLVGQEVSVFAFTDGNTVVPMVAACDYKRALDDDKGPNTGGMGSYSPPKFLTEEHRQTIRKDILERAVQAMTKEGRPYKGVLYGGLMITKDGPKALEFNCRFGDPETQVVLPLLKTDLLEIILAVVESRLGTVKIDWEDEACVGVVMASGGYPGSYATGYAIQGLDSLDKDMLVFHAGTKLKRNESTGNDEVVTEGGRVLTLVARGKTLAEARKSVYNNIRCVHFHGCHYRKDIAKGL
ncbi:MAG: phosphoribosylamine--glycine ligase [Chloroflexi bacterium]|nr:phosphoribosylamine--glycine ligase [Chloroflexota bacterium]